MSWGLAAVALVLALIVHDTRLLLSCVRLFGRAGVATVSALRAGAGERGRCLLIGRLRDASGGPATVRSGQAVAWYRALRTWQTRDNRGEFGGSQTVPIAVDTGPESLVLDDGTGTAVVPAHLVTLDSWRSVMTKTIDVRNGAERTEEWIIPAGADVAFVGAWVRRGGGVVELASSRTWAAEALRTPRLARTLLLMRATGYALRVLGLATVGGIMSYVIVGVNAGLISG
ncbi:hypothetical protein [Dactylosporangium sp. CA-092794]|uniref:hypothetical protein n=1 Tax=Dactylosporangium sp. CA-092794 TaxID=3239929 RepID=UPI003D8B6DDA